MILPIRTWGQEDGARCESARTCCGREAGRRGMQRAEDGGLRIGHPFHVCQNPEPCAACCNVPCGSCELRNLSLPCKMLQKMQPCADLAPSGSPPARQVPDWEMEAHGVQHPSGFHILLPDTPRGKSCCRERSVCLRHRGGFGAPWLSTVPSCLAPLMQEESKPLCTATTPHPPHPIPSAPPGLLPVPVSSARHPPPGQPMDKTILYSEHGGSCGAAAEPLRPSLPLPSLH